MENRLGLFVVGDSEKCTGCKACELACFAAHKKNRGSGNTVGTVTSPVIPRLFLTKFDGKCMPVQCKQCEDAPCLNSCSLNAITRIDGAMIVNENLCIGCKNCIMACPFGAVELLPLYHGGKAITQVCAADSKIVAYKCDRCMDIDSPACVSACPNDALRLVDLVEENKIKKIKSAVAGAASII